MTLLHVFCRDTKMDLTGYVPQLIRCLILMFTSGDQRTLQEAWNALFAVTKNLDPSDQMVYVSDVRQAVRYVVCLVAITFGFNKYNPKIWAVLKKEEK